MPYNFLSGLDLTGANFGAAPAQIPVNQVAPAPIAQPAPQTPFTNYGSNNYGLGNTGFLSGLDFSSYQNPFQQPVQNAPALAPLAGIPALAPPPALPLQGPIGTTNNFLTASLPPQTGPASQQMYALNPGEDYDDYQSRVTAAQQADPNFNLTDYQQALRTGTGIAALAPPAVNQLPPAVNQLPPPVLETTPPALEETKTPALEERDTPAFDSLMGSQSSSSTKERDQGLGIRPFDGSGLAKVDYDLIVSKDGDTDGDAYISTNEWTNWTLDKGPTASFADTWAQRMEDTRNNADEYGINASTLARLNELDANGLQIGRENFYADKDDNFAYEIGYENSGTKYDPMTFRENGSRALSADARRSAQNVAYTAVFEGDPEDIEVPDSFYETGNENKLAYFNHLLKAEGRSDIITQTPRERPKEDDPENKDPEENEDGFWWDSLELSSEGNLFTDPTYQLVALGSVEALRNRLANDGATEDLANFESWYAANPSGYASPMWNWFMKGQGGSGSDGFRRTVPIDKVGMLQDSSNYTVGNRADQLRQAVPIPDGGRVATDFKLKYEGMDGPIRDPGTGVIIRPGRPDNPFDTGNRPPGYPRTPFERPLGPAAPHLKDELTPDFARGGVVKPLTGIQTLGR